MKTRFVKITTSDGCEIRLHRQQGHGVRRGSPVLLVHGFAANAHMWQPPSQEGHLASYLSHFGHTVFAIDLRFRRGTPNKDWNLDDYVFFDIPAALDYIEQETSSRKVHWIGHSMGGLLGYMYQAVNGSSRLKSLITIGSPGLKVPASQGPMVGLLKNVLSIGGFGIQTGRLDLIPRQIMAHLVKIGFLSEREHRLQLAIQYEEDLKTKHILGNISLGEARQLTSIVTKRGMYSPKFNFHYQDQITQSEAPLLAIAGNRDFIVPERLVKQGFLSSQSPNKTFVRLGSKQNSMSYGHLDLIMSPHAKADSWELVRRWIAQWDQYRSVLYPVGVEGISPFVSSNLEAV